MARATTLFQERIGALTEAGIRRMVRVLGQSVVRSEAPWLDCPLGPPGPIGSAIYERLIEREGIRPEPAPDAGLMEDFDLLKSPTFDPARLHPVVRDFYEHTARYRLEAWSDANLWTRFFLWGLVTFVSRRMNQLNFPLTPLELSGGMTNEVTPFVDAVTGKRRYTGWLRRLASTGHVIYAGLYTIGRPANHPDPGVKVSFPLPQGSATVFFRLSLDPDGSLRLTSSGRRFGDPGFYRMVEDGPERWKVRYFGTLREFFHVYVDRQEVLRTDHRVQFLGLTVLRLHYKITPASPVTDSTGGGTGGMARARSSESG